MIRFVIEGEWTGYVSRQRRVVHRSVHSGEAHRLRSWAENAHAIRYTDGTSLILSVRDAKPRERVTPIHGYMKLIIDCYMHNVTSVAELSK